MKNTTKAAIRRRRFIELTGAGIGATALAGCLGDDDNDGDDGNGDSTGDTTDDGSDTNGDGGDDDPIVIGGVHPYTGPFGPHATAFTAGFDYRIDEINADGGVLDRDLVHETADTELDPTEATTIATEFIEAENAVALTGPISTDVGLQVADTAEEFEVPLVFDMVGAQEAITRDSRYTYRLGLLPAPTYVDVAAQFIEERDLEVVRAVIADYGYGRAFETAMNEIFPDDLDFDVEVAPFMEDDFAPYLQNMPDEVDALIVSSHPPGAYSIQRQRLEVGMEAEWVLGIGDSKLTWNAIGEDATENYLAMTQPYPYDDAFVEVAERFGEDTGDEFGMVEALGYVAASVIAEGIESAGEADPVAVSDAIREIELDTLFAEPVQYTEWGELDQKRIVYSRFEEGAPDYYPDGEFHLEEEFVSEVLDGFDPDNW